MKRFTFFGDSICVGQHFNCCETWVIGAAKRILKETSDDVLVTNVSVNGNTTRMALERMPYDVQADGADLIYIQFGINDSNYWATDGGEPRIQRSAYRENLLEIIIRAKTFGARKVFLGTNHYTRKDVVVRGVTQNHFVESHKYNEVIREVSRLVGDVVLVDHEKAIYEAFGSDWESCDEALLPDGIHLGAKGHELYLKTFEAEALPTAKQLLT